ncbi:NAD(P)H-binding protein [Kitasatospora sp. NPDC054939]
MKVLVVGASGTVGRQVTAQLAAEGVEVVALGRRPPGGAPASGVRPVQGDLTDAASLAAAARGVDAVFLSWPLPTADGAAAAVAALTARATAVVQLSSAAVRDVPGRGPESPGRPDAAIEALVAATGVRHTALRPGGFMANTLRWAGELRGSGTVRGFGGGAGLALIDERDIAAVAVRALLEERHHGARYALTGPAAPTQAEQVRLIGRVVGRRFRWEEVSRAEAHTALLGAGWPPSVVAGALDHLAARIDAPEEVTDTVEAVTGSPARPLEEWLADRADRFR